MQVHYYISSSGLPAEKFTSVMCGHRAIEPQLRTCAQDTGAGVAVCGRLRLVFGAKPGMYMGREKVKPDIV